MQRSKKILWTVVIVLVVLALTGIIIASAFLGDIVKKGVETVGPQITKVSINLDEVRLSLLNGTAQVKGLVVGNPTGYQTPHAISASTIAVGLNPLSVLSDKLVLRSIYLESPEITFEGGLAGNNLSQILNNISSTAKSGGTTATNSTAQTQSSKKYEVDDLLITGAKAHVRLTDLNGREVTLELPPIHLTDLGKSEQGITAADLSRNVMQAILAATLKAVSNSSKDLGQDVRTLIKGTGNNLDQSTSNALQGVFKSLTK